MKACFKCGEVKPLDEFYKLSGMRDGRLNKCKECTKSDVRKHRKENLEKIREYDRSRAKLPHRVERNTKNTSAYRKAYPERYKANSMVGYALKIGALKKHPCQICGDERVEAHHADYSRPLDVVWLCPAHHREIHLAYDDVKSAT